MRLLRSAGFPLITLIAIVLGSTAGITSPDLRELAGHSVDATVLCLVGLLFFEVKLHLIRRGHGTFRLLVAAWVSNFLIIPVVGFGVASLFLAGEPLLLTGLVIYFMAPCTDWFLGFTRLAKGNTSAGAMLLPINMLTQLLLYPLYLTVFTNAATPTGAVPAIATLAQWFLVPLAVAAIARLALRHAPAVLQHGARRAAGAAIPLVLAALIAEIFAANATTILEHVDAFTRILLAAVVFFVLTYVGAELVSRTLRLPYPDKALFTMTTAARNAPLMLAITTVALPGQPLVYAAIITGMLIEFPHLTAITHLLLRQRNTEGHSAQDQILTPPVAALAPERCLPAIGHDPPNLASDQKFVHRDGLGCAQLPDKINPGVSGWKSGKRYILHWLSSPGCRVPWNDSQLDQYIAIALFIWLSRTIESAPRTPRNERRHHG